MKSEAMVYLFGIAFLILLCVGVGSCKKWQYDECIKVGHGATYCAAVVAGCFDSSKK